MLALSVDNPEGLAMPAVYEHKKQEMYLKQEDAFSCVVPELTVEDRCLGTLVTLSVPKSGGARSVLEKIGKDLEEMSGLVRSEKLRLDMAYYRRRDQGDDFIGFYEVFKVKFGLDAKYKYVAGRGKLEKKFEVICLEDAVADVAVLTATDGAKPRATATADLTEYDVRSFRVRLGTLNQGSAARTVVLAVRFQPLRPSHAGAKTYETDFIINFLGLKDFAVHGPVSLKQSGDGPFYDLDHLLNVVTCFRNTFFGETQQEETTRHWPPTPYKPPLSLFPRAAQRAVRDYDPADEARLRTNLNDRIDTAIDAVNRGHIHPPTSEQQNAPKDASQGGGGGGGGGDTPTKEEEEKNTF